MDILAVRLLKEVQVVLVELEDVPPLVLDAHSRIAVENVRDLPLIRHEVVVVASIVHILDQVGHLLAQNVRLCPDHDKGKLLLR